MAKRKTKKTEGEVFKRGVTFADGTRYEAGAPVPNNLTGEERDALETLDAFAVPGEATPDAVLDAEEIE